MTGLARGKGRWTAALLSALIVYLVAHTVSGRDGLANFVGLQERERSLEAQLAAVEARRDALRARGARLRTRGLDLDLLEERARFSFNGARVDEIVILTGAL